MKTYQWRKNVLLEIVLLIVVVSFMSLSIQNGAGSQAKRQKSVKEPETYNGPVVDYDASPRIASVTDQKERAVNEAKSNRYNHRAPQPLADFASVIFENHTHWNVGLAPLPINASDTIVLGKVVDAQAYLSADRAGVYSEFTINTERIFKNSGLPTGDSLVLEREGGVVRFSSGRLLPYKISGQRLPRSEREYVFFLKHNPEGDDYHVLTAYEIFENRTLPLDEPDQFQIFKDMEAEQFFKTLQDAIVDSSRQKGGTNN